MRKLLPTVAVIIAAFLILHNPTGAATDVRHLFAAVLAFVNAL